jgi:hypothetical protein
VESVEAKLRPNNLDGDERRETMGAAKADWP